MSFSELYQLVQKQAAPISSKWIEEQALKLSRITKVKEQWSSVVDMMNLRGFYLEGPLGPPVTLADNQSLIVLSRSMCVGPQGPYWRRFVKTKELMHVFDTDDECADSEERFDLQIEKFSDPAAPMSPQYRAETKAYYRALAVLCPEAERLSYRGQLQRNEIGPEVVATAFRIPSNAIFELMRDDFLERVDHSK